MSQKDNMIVACFKHYVLMCLMTLRGPTFLAFGKSLVESDKDCLLEHLIVLPRSAGGDAATKCNLSRFCFLISDVRRAG